MIKHNLLPGFVPGRDCMAQLLLCLEDWTNIMENGDADFAKPFDSFCS